MKPTKAATRRRFHIFTPKRFATSAPASVFVFFVPSVDSLVPWLMVCRSHTANQAVNCTASGPGSYVFSVVSCRGLNDRSNLYAALRSWVILGRALHAVKGYRGPLVSKPLYGLLTGNCQLRVDSPRAWSVLASFLRRCCLRDVWMYSYE